MIRALWRQRYLLWQWSRRLLALRYAGSILGPVWNLLTPLFMLCVYTFVFGIVFHARWQMPQDAANGTGHYAVALFCGMAIFNIFSETVSGCCRAVLDNANLVKKVVFPLEILPVAQMLAAAIAGQLWFALLLIAAMCVGIPLSWTILLFPLALAPLMALACGVGWFVAATSVYFRDMPHFTAMLLQALFFMTPVFYPESLVPAQLSFVLDINPLAWLCRMGREMLLFNTAPSWRMLALAWLVAGIVLKLGYAWFIRLKRGFADVL